jgi:hypothetical protein
MNTHDPAYAEYVYELTEDELFAQDYLLIDETYARFVEDHQED